MLLIQQRTDRRRHVNTEKLIQQRTIDANMQIWRKEATPKATQES